MLMISDDATVLAIPLYHQYLSSSSDYLGRGFSARDPYRSIYPQRVVFWAVQPFNISPHLATANKIPVPFADWRQNGKYKHCRRHAHMWNSINPGSFSENFKYILSLLVAYWSHRQDRMIFVANYKDEDIPTNPFTGNIECSFYWFQVHDIPTHVSTGRIEFSMLPCLTQNLFLPIILTFIWICGCVYDMQNVSYYSTTTYLSYFLTA